MINDKSCGDYHKKDVSNNCWERVRLILGLESVAVAKHNFILLRKRFNKTREKQKNSKPSGTSREDMLKKCGDVEVYEFLSWLTPFIVSRQTKSNISTTNNSVASSSSSSFDNFSENEAQCSYEIKVDNECESGDENDGSAFDNIENIE